MVLVSVFTSALENKWSGIFGMKKRDKNENRRKKMKELFNYNTIWLELAFTLPAISLDGYDM